MEESALQRIQEEDRENEQEELGVENLAEEEEKLADEESRLEEDPFENDHVVKTDQVEQLEIECQAIPKNEDSVNIDEQVQNEDSLVLDDLGAP